ncbi:M56 family metallopeptidase [Mucilaginibacter sp. BJC16-A38]|uniref:M56 family metallopeptidase n=1 Tax=Mucilaginibacter phenanthrenivorans TaxID=1234842 RepID=UPI0021584544|nr:M56 family metallopeptidase [Mucilaginibacter phenanthrenivorans]MCR8556089.1 M56 family metallopeptidase [Mucilaginibacter phenanthrenivorans]
MPDLFIFLLKVNAALLLFCAGYYLVLRHLTFYTLNRIYLLTAILFATVYPKINLSAFVERHKQIVKPVEGIMLRWQAPAKALINERPDYWLWVEVVFWAGVILLAARLMVQLYSLFKLYRNSTAAQIYNHNVRIMNTDSGPFSFWKSIYINPANHEPSDLRSILQHEQIHVSEWHTLDVLLAELSTIFYWFNPGVWLMKKAVKENIEFITDRKILRNGTDSKQYQYSLVNVSFSAAPQGIVNHFNISTIKKRIIMMNAKRSSNFKLTRYAFLVPAVVAMLLVFSISKAALVKKSISNIKASSLALLERKNPAPVNVPNNKVNTSAGVVTKKNIAQQKIIVKLIDTIRKGKIFISSSDKLDSVNIVINGVKASKTDFDKINPNDIEAINIVSPNVGNNVIFNLDNKHGTVFVTTKGSEAGAKFREKMDKWPYNAHGINGTGNSSGNLTSVVVVGHPSATNGDSDYDGPTKVESFNITSSNPATITVRGNNASGSGVVVYDNKLYKDTSIKVVKGYSILADTFKSLKNNSRPYKVNGSSGRTYSNFQVVTSPNHFSVDHIADKMIIINGKISTQADLKKISAFDIDKMVLKTDNETKELYGDRAKNGIVFIVTKK